MIVYGLNLHKEVHSKQILYAKHISITDVDLFYGEVKRLGKNWADLDYVFKLITLRKL